MFSNTFISYDETLRTSSKIKTWGDADNFFKYIFSLLGTYSNQYNIHSKCHEIKLSQNVTLKYILLNSIANCLHTHITKNTKKCLNVKPL